MLWAKGCTRPETWERDYKLQDKIATVGRFFAFVGKSPWEVRPEDVEHWREDLARAGQQPATVYTRVSRVSSFYKWLMADPQLRELVRANPVLLARPRHPRPYQSASVKAWSDEETAAILGVVRAQAESGSIVGKRDYALLLFYLYTGLRRSEVIALRGRALEYKEGRLLVHYRRKGGKYVAREVGEPEVWGALLDYLSSADRLAVFQNDGALWTRHDRAGKPGPPLGSRAFANNLQKYAQAAGIDHVHLHQTRHTYARIVAEETGSYLETQEALDHENAATTRAYVQRITVKADKHSDKIARRLKRR